MRTYSKLKRISTFENRFEYAKIGGIVGETTFGKERYLNQILYGSKEWKETRKICIIRDDGCDLGLRDYPIYGKIYIHHLNPITIDDILQQRGCVFDPEFLICTSLATHNAIHFGSLEQLCIRPIERRPNDTCPWK